MFGIVYNVTTGHELLFINLIVGLDHGILFKCRLFLDKSYYRNIS